MQPSRNAILVKFGDNDFYSTWCAVLSSAASNQRRSIFQVKDKKKLAFILSQAAWGMYCLHQNQCEYNGLQNYDADYIEHMKRDLTIQEKHILLDDEVGKYIKENEWKNGESFYVYEYDGKPLSI